jgi:phage gpG-like protein
MANVQIKVDLRELEALRRAGADVGRFRRPMLQYVTWLEAETKLQFAREVDPQGQRWAALKPSTLKRKKSGAILRESGVMINTLYNRATETEGEVGIGTDYSIFHQEGTDKMDKREILGVTPEREAKGQQIFETYVSSQLP